jgi:hypothetical protein
MLPHRKTPGLPEFISHYTAGRVWSVAYVHDFREVTATQLCSFVFVTLTVLTVYSVRICGTGHNNFDFFNFGIFQSVLFFTGDKFIVCLQEAITLQNLNTAL